MNAHILKNEEHLNSVRIYSMLLIRTEKIEEAQFSLPQSRFSAIFRQATYTEARTVILSTHLNVHQAKSS